MSLLPLKYESKLYKIFYEIERSESTAHKLTVTENSFEKFLSSTLIIGIE